MNTSTETPPTTAPTRSWRGLGAALWDFVGSMRLAVSLLTVLSIASVIGTVFKQNEAAINAVNQFGGFWGAVFLAWGLNDIYNQLWFLVILVFLVASTSVCLIRNTPKMLREMREFKLHQRTHSLQHHGEYWQGSMAGSVEDATAQAAQMLTDLGYQTRAQSAQLDGQSRVYFAAKRGRFNRLGYILTHIAIVVICLGGLLDSELSIRAQVWLTGKVPLAQSVSYSDVPEGSTLPENTLSYRGNIRIPEGKAADFVELSYDQNSYLLQNLPFALRLNRFTVEYYSTGMPKHFASEVTVVDKATGQTFDTTIAVNHPLRYKGVAVYQASFDANNSALDVRVHPLQGTFTQSKDSSVKVGDSQNFAYNGQTYTLDWREFRPTNVLPIGDGNLSGQQALAQALSTHATATQDKKLQNFGPSVRYVVRNAAGDDTEFLQYATPVRLEGVPTLVTGRRDAMQDEYTYYRIPVDADQSVGDFMRLRAALANPEMLRQAAEQYARNNSQATGVNTAQISQAVQQTLSNFAEGGLEGLGRKIESGVPEAQRDAIATSIARMLEGALWETLHVARKQEGLPERAWNEAAQKFIRVAPISLSDYRQFASPVWVELAGANIQQASVLQATRSPGQMWVYLGSLSLVLGVLCMTFIRERRVWLHLIPDAAGAVTWHIAMSSTRRTLDYHKHWQALTHAAAQRVDAVGASLVGAPTPNEDTHPASAPSPNSTTTAQPRA